MNISKFIEELKRRNVFKVATAYAIAGWLIIQITDTVFPRIGLPDWTITFIIALVGVGFPIAIILAWAFEITPDGMQKSKNVDITESVTAQTGKKLNGIIIAVLSVALFFVVIERVFFAKASILEDVGFDTEIETASIAVLPFVNMSSDQENEYFSDGLSEELLNALAKVEDMQVAGRTSSFKFKGQNENLTEIGSELGVANILEGSVRKSGNRLRITAQLIRVSDGFHMWSETYDREFTVDNIFDIQEEISRHVLDELKVRLLPNEELELRERPTKDIEAYNAYLEATQVEINRSLASLEEAIGKYKDAIRIDPTFAEAYARLAIAYYLSHAYSSDRSEEAIEETRQLMRENIDQAQLLNPNSGYNFHALGLYFYLVQDYEKAEAADRKAIELLPNDPIVHNSLYVTLRAQDEMEEAYRILEKAYHLDPLNPVVARNYSRYLIDIEREFDQGLKIINQIIENYPDYMPIKAEKAWLLRDIPYGRQNEAFTLMFEAYKDEPSNYPVQQQLIEIAIDVELYPFAEYMIREMDEMYAEFPFATFTLKRLYSFSKNETQEFKQRIEAMVNSGDMPIQNFERIMLRVNLIEGNYTDLIESAFKLNPELSLAQPAVVDSNRFVALNLIPALIKTGNKEQANAISQSLCVDVPESIDDLEEAVDHSVLYVRQIECQAFLGEFDKAIQGTERLYFEENSKANWPSAFNSSPDYILLDGNQEYMALKKRILDDLHIKREKIIAFLKVEGEWKEEWEEGN